MMRLIKLVPVLFFGAFSLTAQVGQINIPRVELMPNEPAPFFMRDW